MRLAFNNRIAYFDLEVKVVLRSGQESDPNQLFGYDGLGDPPFNQPFGLIGYRDIGSPETVHLRWLYTDMDLSGTRDTRYYRDADRFVIQPVVPSGVHTRTTAGTALGNGSSDNATADEDGSSLLWNVQKTQLTNIPIDPERGIYEYTYTMVGFERKPYWFEVQALNNAGSGNFSAPSNMVTESCNKDQFLQTNQEDTNSILCADCPEGAFCAGLDHDNVTALQGYWRVPWSDYGLVF